MTSGQRRKQVYESSKTAQEHRLISAGKRTQSSILLTEQGWTAHKADNDSTHEWAYIRTVEDGQVSKESVRAFQCMHCKLEKRADATSATYITSQGVSHTCTPCPKTIAVPQLTTGDTK